MYLMQWRQCLRVLNAKTVETALQVYNKLLVFAKKINAINIAVQMCESCSAVYHIDSLQQHKNCHIAVLAVYYKYL